MKFSRCTSQAALKVAAQSHGGKGDELAALRTEVEVCFISSMRNYNELLLFLSYVKNSIRLFCCSFCTVPANYDPKTDAESRGDGMYV